VITENYRGSFAKWPTAALVDRYADDLTNGAG
jgi:hypothetical protein